MAVSQKIRVAKLGFLCTALLNNVYCQCLKFQVDSFYSLEIMAWKRTQKAKLQMLSVADLVLVHCIFHNVLYKCMKLTVDSFNSLEVMVQAKSQSKNFPNKKLFRAITQTIKVSELWFLCNALLNMCSISV